MKFNSHHVGMCGHDELCVLRFIGITQQLPRVMRRKTYGRVVLEVNKLSKFVLEHLGVFIPRKTKMYRRGGDLIIPGIFYKP